MQIIVRKHPLIFKQAAGTSRGVLRQKNTWFIKIYDPENPLRHGLGEINMFEGLSYDDRADFYDKLQEIRIHPEETLHDIHASLIEFPSIRFGVETALSDLNSKHSYILFPSEFTQGNEGIPINGLIWMGKKDFMLAQIKRKLDMGFHCLKMKIGAINFETELQILQSIRKEYKESDLELRVDANGAFPFSEALGKLDKLSSLNLHSIEQPIKQGHWSDMRNLCQNTPLPIALDEELIGINTAKEKRALLDTINPQYIILKPALVGGFKSSEEWIKLANDKGIKWWITSALESNIGLNAIAQWTYSLQTNNYQGLGTGQLFTNNIASPLTIKGEKLFYNPQARWEKIIG
ncbi:MAG: o-succinylbenzoate synthase [Bacteroidales bacterium]|nr:o-succinylbenzoate synthase [Bacteroidales bacterium]